MNRRYIAWLGVILLLSFASLYPILENGFINRDDPGYIAGNGLIRELSFEGTFRIFAASQYMGNYHPLTLLLFAVEYYFFHNVPAGYHAISLLLHLISTALVFFVFLRLSEKVFVAGIVAALFGIHPMHVESVAWASQQKDLLYTVFYLGALLSYIRYARMGAKAMRFYSITVLLFALSLLSKAMAVPLVAVLFLVDYFLRRDPSRRLFLEKIPFLVLGLAAGILAIMAQRSAGASLENLPYTLFERIIIASYGTITYVLKLILPHNLSAYYPYPFLPGKASGAMFLYPFVLVFLAAGVVATLRFTRKMAFGFGFFLCSIVIIVQILPIGGAVIADRYAYVSSLGIFYLMGELLEYVRQKEWISIPARNIALSAFFAAIILLLGGMTWKRSSIWKDSVALWTDALSKSPDIPFIYAYRGNARPLPQESEAAISDLNRAIRLQPDMAFGYYSRGYLYARIGKHEAAITDYTEAIELNYEPVVCYSNRGSSYTALHRYEEAISDFTRAISTNPGYVEAHANRANVYLATQRYTLAIADLDVVLELSGPDVVPLYNRGIARHLLGDSAGGCSDLNRAAAMGFQPAISGSEKYCR